MTAACLDTSFFLAIVFGEPRASMLMRTLRRFDHVYASDLIVAEALSASAREQMDAADVLSALRSISLLCPPRTLEKEIGEALAHGWVRGADAWHLAAALFLASITRTDVAFLSRDRLQRTVARRLGFATP